ncbi:hypothetical protein [Treponema sp. R80B11-R83G3]
MESKKIIFLFLYTAVFLFSGLLYAQESSPESPGYFVDTSAGEPVFKQRLVWDKEDYVLYYEVSIQVFSGQYREYHVEITKNNFLEISLNPGRYRYSVTPFDLLERRCESSDWEEFTITAAFQPEIIKIVPEYFYMDQNKNRVLLISGNNIFDDSVIYLRNEENELFPIEKVVTNNSSVKLIFNDDTLIPGTYEIFIKNPGGLEVVLGGFFIGYHRYIEAFFKLGFNPILPLNGELEDLFGPYMYFPGVTFRLESLSSQRASFKAGLEFALSFYYLNDYFSTESLKVMDDNYRSSNVSLFDFSLNISLQKRYNHLRNAVTLSFGFGFTAFNGSGYIYNDDGYYDNDNYYYYDRIEYVKNEVNAYADIGLSGLFLITESYYIETGVELVYYFKGSSFLLRPRISMIIKV